MDSKDQLAAYLKLYERQMAHYEATQGVEWKGSFGVWTLLAAAVYLASQNLTAENPVIIDRGLAMVFLLPVAIHGSWLLRMHWSGEFDKKLWSRYRRAAREILLAANQANAAAQVLPSDEEEYRGLGFWRRAWWLALQVGVTAGLAGTLAFLLGGATAPLAASGITAQLSGPAARMEAQEFYLTNEDGRVRAALGHAKDFPTLSFIDPETEDLGMVIGVTPSGPVLGVVQPDGTIRNYLDTQSALR